MVCQLRSKERTIFAMQQVDHQVQQSERYPSFFFHALRLIRAKKELVHNVTMVFLQIGSFRSWGSVFERGYQHKVWGAGDPPEVNLLCTEKIRNINSHWVSFRCLNEFQMSSNQRHFSYAGGNKAELRQVVKPHIFHPASRINSHSQTFQTKDRNLLFESPMEAEWKRWSVGYRGRGHHKLPVYKEHFERWFCGTFIRNGIRPCEEFITK